MIGISLAAIGLNTLVDKLFAAVTASVISAIGYMLKLPDFS
jgi:hypothetical protein